MSTSTASSRTIRNIADQIQLRLTAGHIDEAVALSLQWAPHFGQIPRNMGFSQYLTVTAPLALGNGDDWHLFCTLWDVDQLKRLPHFNDAEFYTRVGLLCGLIRKGHLRIALTLLHTHREGMRQHAPALMRQLFHDIEKMPSGRDHLARFNWS